MAYLNFPRGLRPDLFLYPLLALGFILSPFAHLVSAVAIGYVVDTLAGRLWGFHVATYVIISSIMHATSEQVDIHSSFYQILLIGCYVMLQQFCIFLYAIGSWGVIDAEKFITDWILRTIIMVIIGLPSLKYLKRFISPVGS